MGPFGYESGKLKIVLNSSSPWEPPWALEELDIVGFMIDSGLKLSHEQHEPDWQNCSLENFALISAKAKDTSQRKSISI